MSQAAGWGRGWQVAVVSVGEILQLQHMLAPHGIFSKSTFLLFSALDLLFLPVGDQEQRDLLSEQP